MTRYSLIRFVLACGILGGVSAIRADEPSKPDSKDQQIEALREKVREQAAEIARLKRQVQELRAREGAKAPGAPAPRLVPPPGVVPPAGPNPIRPGTQGNAVPPNWIPREFNGTTYYLIPLSPDELAAEGTVTVSVQPVPAKPGAR